MSKKKKLIKNTISIILALALFVAVIVYEYNHRIYDKTKDSIFEIPDTISIKTSNQNGIYIIENNYIIQNIPSNTLKTEKMIYKFVTDENILQHLYDKYNHRDDIGCIRLIFRKPSWKLPVYWNGRSEDIDGFSDELLVIYNIYLNDETDPYTNEIYIGTSATATFYVDIAMNRLTNINLFTHKDLGSFGKLAV